ncbi:MAG TPA: hypothetical protein DCM14_06740 [Clostridiales bacterium UBA8153]|nr:hypothetical protein [Clostridiales bacterium UBA8153]
MAAGLRNGASVEGDRSCRSAGPISLRLPTIGNGKPASELLFNLISARTGRGSMIISINLEFSRRPELFGVQRLTAALVDRLTFKSAILNMNGESYRLQQRLAHEVRA